MPTSGPMSIPVSVHDTRHWAGRALYYDVLALSVCILSAVALALDIYQAGYLRAVGGPASVGASFRPLLQLALEGLLFIVAFAWIAGRIIRAAYREMPRV